MGVEVIDVTQVQVEHLIGRGGATLKGLQDSTGARVEVVGGPKVRITGDSGAKVAAAAEQVRAIIANQENPHGEDPVGAQLRKEAAAAIAECNDDDKGKGEDDIDMHDPRKDEATALPEAQDQADKEIPKATAKGFGGIPGAGRFSALGKQALGAAVDMALDSTGIPLSALPLGALKSAVTGAAKAAAAAGKEKGKKDDKEPDSSGANLQSLATEKAKSKCVNMCVVV
ncbi:Smr domain containing protein [Trypanosoma conorhini]|uniref:Smr domain containing protein n=1 Tax=Trypanosoma conorhini TaxID=83891 RepID=A0A3R7SAZ7_9TRYP|nr:Smr domain containing protein [Trypanosoma conorhini]RNF27326.1 Smr domain containing protein [Trypanosoma conorhini]